METRIDWMQVGKEHWEGNQDRLKVIMGRVEWHKLPYTMAMMPGEAIKGLVKEFKIPKVSHVCDSHELAPYGLVGIRAHYKNADVEFFAVDEGSHISPLCAYVTERPTCVCVTVQEMTVETKVTVEG